jgi:hypothetical protein
VWRLLRLVGLLCSACQFGCARCVADRGCFVAAVGIPLAKCNNGNNNNNNTSTSWPYSPSIAVAREAHKDDGGGHEQEQSLRQPGNTGQHKATHAGRVDCLQLMTWEECGGYC